MLSGSAEYPLLFSSITGPNDQHVGVWKGKLGAFFRWEFLYDIAAPLDTPNTLEWEWRFRVFDIRGTQLYQATQDCLPLLREHAQVKAIKEQVAYQAQLFLEEYLHEKVDLGSGHHRKRP